VVGATVIRDLQLEVKMASTLIMRIPGYPRYDLENHNDEPKSAALQAFWALPPMVGQYLCSGIRAVPAGVQLSKALVANQGFGGTLGFLSGFRGLGTGSKGVVARFLDAAAVERAGQRSVFVGEVGSEPATLKRIRVFTEAG
jgi:hypothetical protein